MNARDFIQAEISGARVRANSQAWLLNLFQKPSSFGTSIDLIDDWTIDF